MGDKYCIRNPSGAGTGKYQLYSNFPGSWQGIVQSSEAAPLNQWTHVAFTWNLDSGDARVYYNAVQKASATVTGTASAGTYLVIGCYNNGPTYAFNGTIDEVNIYTKALSATEVRQLYESYQDWSEWAGPDYVHCYDEETEILTDEGWKFFKNLDENDLVATLNPETGETEFQAPIDHQIYDYDGEMYKVTGEGFELVVSPEHRVYSKLSPINPVVMVEVLEEEGIPFQLEGEDEASNVDSLEVPHISSEVLEVEDCGLIEVDDLLDLLSDCNSECPVLSPELIQLLTQDGGDFEVETQSKSPSSNPSSSSSSFRVIGMCGPLSILFNSSTYSSLTSRLSSSGIPPMARTFLLVSSSSTSPSVLENALLAMEDQLTQSTLDIRSLSSSGTDSVMVPILDTSLYVYYVYPKDINKNNVVPNSAGNADFIKKPSPVASLGAGFGESGSSKLENRHAAKLGTTDGCAGRCHKFDKKQVTETGTQIHSSGNGNLNSEQAAGVEIPADAFAENSGDAGESAMGALAIDCVGSGFCAEVSGASGVQEVQDVVPNYAEFNLLRISDVYEEYLDGKEVVFLDANLDAIKVEKIEKVPYSGRIYDVDVPNDIILVRRGSSSRSEDILTSHSSVKINYGLQPQFFASDRQPKAGEYERQRVEASQSNTATATIAKTNKAAATETNKATTDAIANTNSNSIKQSRAIWSGNSNQDDKMIIGLDFSELEFPEGYVDNPYDDPDLVGYWRFDNGSGSQVIDSSSSGYNGSCNGTGDGNCNWTTGKVGQAVLFDGSDDSFISQDNLSGYADGSMETWVKWNAQDAEDTAVALSNSVPESEYARLGISSNAGMTANKIGFSLYAAQGGSGCSGWDAASSDITPTNGEWYHLVGVWGSGGIKVYVDGVLEGTFACTGRMYPGQRVSLGGSNAGYFNGTIDEVRISTIARRPVSGLWTLNYTTNSSTEAMNSGNRYYWKVRALDGGGEQ